MYYKVGGRIEEKIENFFAKSNRNPEKFYSNQTFFTTQYQLRITLSDWFYVFFIGNLKHYIP